MTSAVHYTLLLFIYEDGSRGISGGSAVFSFDNLKFLFCLFPIWVSYLCFRLSQTWLFSSWEFCSRVRECYVFGWSARKPTFFPCPTEGHRELSAAVRVKCDLLFEFHWASWTAADLITAHCVHTHKTHHHAAEQTTDADPFVSSNCYPSQLKALAVILTAVRRTDGRCIRFHGRFVFLRASGLHAMFDITRASVHAASYWDNGGWPGAVWLILSVGAWWWVWCLSSKGSLRSDLHRWHCRRVSWWICSVAAVHPAYLLPRRSCLAARP